MGKKKFTDYQRRKLRKQIKELTLDRDAEHRQAAYYRSAVQTARGDAFREYSNRSGMINEATRAIASEIGKRLAEKIVEPLLEELKSQGLTPKQVEFISTKIGQMAGPQFEGFAAYKLESFRKYPAKSLIEFDASRCHERAVHIIHGRIEPIEYNIAVEE